MKECGTLTPLQCKRATDQLWSLQIVHQMRVRLDERKLRYGVGMGDGRHVCQQGGIAATQTYRAQFKSVSNFESKMLKPGLMPADPTRASKDTESGSSSCMRRNQCCALHQGLRELHHTDRARELLVCLPSLRLLGTLCTSCLFPIELFVRGEVGATRSTCNLPVAQEHDLKWL